MVCSHRRACLAVTFGFLAIIIISAIIAFTKSGCPEAVYKGEPIEGYGSLYHKRMKKMRHIATNGEDFPWTKIKLPEYIQPLLYSIFIHPDMETKLIKGNVSIAFTSVEETDFIVLHVKNLNISYKSLEDKHKERISITKFLVYPYHQQIYLGLSRILHRGSNYTLTFVYETEFSRLNGIYISYYKYKDHHRGIISTHFEPTFARSAFPCFDEPHLKARFKLTLVRPVNQIALFNMPLASSRPHHNSSDMVVDEFEESVEMSSYLVAFVICDYANNSARTKNGTLISVYTPRSMIAQSDYALKIAIKMLQHYEMFFGVPYPLPKLDMITIPKLGAGAMENWGLITFRESILLYDPMQTSAKAKQRTAVVIAHELAHQWFGNLVTMTWWQDLWLNEGFASFMENLGASVVEPGWAMNEQFIVEKMQPALALDALVASHPISVPVKDPADIESIFDVISYKKGASVISMLRECLGEKILQSGLRNYLIEHHYGNAKTGHFWHALTHAANRAGKPMDVAEMMGSWTSQSGFPLITVSILSDRVAATQTQFLAEEFYRLNLTTHDDDEGGSHVTKIKDADEKRWHIPLTFISSENNVSTLVWMNESSVEFAIPKKLSWLKLNVGQRGLYRVNYDEKGWRMIINLLMENHGQISDADRASILDDAFTLAKSNVLDISTALNITRYLVKETAYAPWQTALAHLNDWADVLDSETVRQDLIAYIFSLIQPQYLRLGWKDEGSHLDKLLREKIILMAVNCRNSDVIDRAIKIFSDWRIKNITVPQNIRSVVYVTALRHGREADWWYIWNKYKITVVPTEKILLMRALAQTTDPWLLQQYLESVVLRDKVRSQDVVTVLSECSINPGGQLAAWRLIRKHWKHLSNIFKGAAMRLGLLIQEITKRFSTPFDYNEVKKFFLDKNLGPAQRALNQSLEMISLNNQFLDYKVDDIRNWVENENIVRPSFVQPIEEEQDEIIEDEIMENDIMED